MLLGEAPLGWSWVRNAEQERHGVSKWYLFLDHHLYSLTRGQNLNYLPPLPPKHVEVTGNHLSEEKKVVRGSGCKIHSHTVHFTVEIYLSKR